MSLEVATQRYWEVSRHLRSQPDEARKEAVKSMVIQPRIAAALKNNDNDEARLLARLVS